MLFFSVLLPTGDLFSDIIFTTQLFQKGHYKFGACSIVPLSISWMMIAVQWFKTESKEKRHKLKTLPLLLLQVYPQWRALRVLYYGKIKRDPRWRKMKEKFDIGISHLEPFIESCPQLHLLFVFWIMSKDDRVCEAAADFFGLCKYEAAVEATYFFYVTLCLSLASATFGIVKFIKAGPASIMRNDKWLDGFGTWTFILIYLNVACTLMAKGLMIGDFIDEISKTQGSSISYLIIFIVFLPQCVHAFGTLCFSLGFRNAMSTMIDHPALVLTPAFSFWTFGPVRANGCCTYRRNEPKICLSFRLTWVNAFLTLAPMIPLIISEYFRIYEEGIVGIIMWLTLASSIISLLLIQFLDKCKWLCCGCLCCCCWKRYEDCCFPMTQKLVYDTENPGK